MALPPRINDISTDLEDPPAIAGRGPLPDRFRPIIARAYPELRPLQRPEPPATVLEAALALANEQSGWRIEAVDKAATTFHAVAITKILRFRDDLTVRIRPDGDGSRVDMRSKSRLGVSDLGANAKRIRGFFAKLTARLS